MIVSNTLMEGEMEKEKFVNQFLEVRWDEWLTTPINGTSVMLIILVLFLGYLWYRKKINFQENHIKWAAFLIFLSGWIIYFVGFFSEGTKGSLVALCARSTLSSLEMFVSHSDLLEVDGYWRESPVYMTCFSVIHASAVLVSGVVIVHYLGVRLASRLRLWGLNRGRREINNVYVFLGVDERSLHLAESITKEKEKNNVVIFIEPQVEEDNHGRLSFSHIFSHFAYKKELLARTNQLNALLLREKRSLSAGDTLKKSGLCKLITKSKNVYFFLLSDNENSNILSTLDLKEDNCLKRKSEQNRGHGKIQIFCHAGRGSVNSVFEWKNTDGIEIKVVDSSYLSILSLKKMCKETEHALGLYRHYLYHPVNFIDIDTEKGVARSDFSSLIIGFGETGQEALRFLYEFGQFPYDREMGNTCHFKCYVWDKAIHFLKGRFLMKSPALEASETGISYQQLDCCGIEFWQKLRVIMDELNYVVIAVGDDEKGIALAVDIYEYAERYRNKRFDKFRIFVRSYKKANEKRLFRVAEQYKEAMTIFGASSDIFVKDVIIDDKLTEMAQKFYYAYERQNMENTALWTGVTPEKLWADRRKKTDKGRWGCQSVMRKEGQDVSNVLHMYTKMKLIGGESNADRIGELRSVFNGASVENAEGRKKFLFFENLAIGEHKRWNAAHRVLGYVQMPKEKYTHISCSEQEKQHVCLVSWKELSEISKLTETNYQEFDRMVVRTTFDIVLNGG